jgi:hypothetical protein
MMYGDDAARVCKRLGQLQSNRSLVEDVWRECFDYTYPMRGTGLALKGHTGSADTNVGHARGKKADLLDATGTDATRTLASSLMSGLTPANSRWFGLDAGVEGDAEKAWLDKAAELLWENIHASNYDAVGFEGMLDFAVAGMCALFIDEDPARGGLTFELWPLDQVYVASSRAGGPVDTVYRSFTLTAEQALKEYGEGVSDQTRELAAKEPDSPVEFVHAIEPRIPHMVGARMAKNLPVASVHVEVTTKKTARISGFHEMPVVVPRWSLIPGSCLATGPVFDVLPDIKSLNETIRFVMTNADMAIAGMWGAVDDGALNPRTVRIGPRKVIVMASKDSFFPLAPAGKFDVAMMEIGRLQKQIRRGLMADVLEPQADSPQMTATEVAVRVELIRQLLGPTYGRMQAEFLRPMIERCFGLAFRAGIFPRVPRSLEDREYSVTYLSPIARAQKLQDVAAMDRYEAGLLALAQAKPEMLDLYQWDDAARMKAERLGVPLELLPTDDDVAAARDARAEQQATQQQVGAAAELMKVAPKVAA